jgi:hypothetical protein
MVSRRAALPVRNTGTWFQHPHGNPVLDFEDSYGENKKEFVLTSYDTRSSGVATFLMGKAREFTIRFHVTRGTAAATADIVVLNNPDTTDQTGDGEIWHNGRKKTFTAGATAIQTATAIASALGSFSDISTSRSSERVTATLSRSGLEGNTHRLRMGMNNVNADGGRRYVYDNVFYGGTSTDSSAAAAVNIHGRIGTQEVVGYGTSLLDSSSQTGRSTTNAIYTFDESIARNFQTITAVWSGLNALDAVTIYVRRYF